MRKYLLSLAVLGSALFTACSSDNDNTTQTYPVAMTSGVYVVGSGNLSNGIDGNLTYYDYTTKGTTKNIFRTTNGMSLGKTANDALRYGDKFYIVVDGENSVFVTDAKTLRVIHRINMTDATILGETQGISPRRITAADDKIYVSTFGGYVAAIDTVNFALAEKYEAGSYSEGLVVNNGVLYVANSDYGNGNASISVINLNTKATQKLTDENIRNPQEIAVAGSDIYFLDWGQYGAAPTYAQENAGVYRISSDGVRLVIPNATGMTCLNTKIYTFNDPYGAVGGCTYSVYDILSNYLYNINIEGIDSPAAIGIDPITNYLFIASRNLEGGYPSYSTDGYVNFYDAAFTKKGSFNCGVGPTRIVFNTGVNYVTY